MTETELQSVIVSLCHYHGLLVHACNRARECTGPGFPDLVIAGPCGVIFAELKQHGLSAVRPDQVTWAHMLQASRQHYRRWTACEWDSGEIRETLAYLSKRSD